jgi:hypothetical protein
VKGTGRRTSHATPSAGCARTSWTGMPATFIKSRIGETRCSIGFSRRRRPCNRHAGLEEIRRPDLPSTCGRRDPCSMAVRFDVLPD